MVSAGKKILISAAMAGKTFLGKRYWGWVYGSFFPRCYRKRQKEPVNPWKVLFVEQRYQELSDNFRLLYEALKKDSRYEIHLHLLQQNDVGRGRFLKNGQKMLEDMATAGYVFLDDACKVMGRVKKRPETKVVQVWHACGAFKKFGMSTAALKFGDNREGILKYPAYANLDYVTVSSPEVIWAYREAMSLEGKETQIAATGISRTDAFFRAENRDKAFERLYQVMPFARGKKVILYAPTFRGTIGEARTPDELELGRMQEALGDEYVLALKHHPFVKKRPELSEKVRESFAKDVTAEMSIEELLFVADICISDYSSLIFEYSLFEKPMAFFAPDLEDYFDWRGFYYNYEELTPGPVFRNQEELTDYLLHIEERFDRQRVADFRERFMSACDGCATERILNLVFKDTEG